MTELDKLMAYIGARYTFTPEHYPVLAGMHPDQKKAFAVSHSVHHMNKSLGKIAAECERYDHGGQLNDAALKEGVVKMLINTIKLAEEIGISAEELGSSVPTYMQSK